MKGKLSAPVRYQSIVIDGMNLAIASERAGRTLGYRGRPTGCLYLSLKKVLSLRKAFPSAKIVVLWEGGSPRDLFLPEYKAQRPGHSSDLYQAVQVTRHAFSLLGITQMAHSGAEADDLAHWYVQRHKEERVLLVSTDRDWYQFVSATVDIMVKNVVYTHSDLSEQLDYPAHHIGIVKILTGDASDNIKGLCRFPTRLAHAIARSCGDYRQIPEFVFSAPDLKWKQVILDNWKQVELNAKVLLPHAEWIREEAIVVVGPPTDTAQAEVNRNELLGLLEEYGITSLEV